MVVSTMNRHLLVQLQTGQTAQGKPKLHNRAYPHVDVSVADEAISQVLEALAPLFADPVYAMGRVDTVQIDATTTTSSTGATTTTSSGTATGTTTGTSTASTATTTSA